MIEIFSSVNPWAFWGIERLSDFLAIRKITATTQSTL